MQWKTPLPGTGHGSPVVWGKKIFLLCADQNTAARTVVCVNAEDGVILWNHAHAAGKHKHHKQNSFASSTPTVDGERVYFSWGTPEQLTIATYTLAGKLAWETHLGPVKGGHGFGASPILHEGLVILNNDQDGESSLIALDARTGKVKWNTPRQSKRLTYSTPVLFRDQLIFTNWTHGITGIDPANGKVLWENRVFPAASNERAIGSPIVAGNLVIGSCGFVTKLKHVVALRPKGKLMEEVWRIEKSVPHIPTPLVLGENIFLWNDLGVVTCAEVATGKIRWSERAIRSGKFFGSPVAADGKIYCAEASGTIVVLRGDGEFEPLAQNDLGETCHSTPAIANGAMYVRTYQTLFSISK
ncbi:MAG: PQQ-like beta-propeller repeat protein [Verrucomicrobia subdivision 3 bacterium]|nr:PQQ-like beta-propeller repeat protein [Limisphaerales bacterium]